MLNEKITYDIWGKKIDLEIIYDCFDGEKITSIQKKTFEEFNKNSETIFKDSYSLIRDYCLSNYSTLVIDNFENIFRYVKPKQIYIKRSVTKKRIFGLLCNFIFDREHGLAVYVEDGKVTMVGAQDIVL